MCELFFFAGEPKRFDHEDRGDNSCRCGDHLALRSSVVGCHDRPEVQCCAAHVVQRLCFCSCSNQPSASWIIYAYLPNPLKGSCVSIVVLSREETLGCCMSLDRYNSESVSKLCVDSGNTCY